MVKRKGWWKGICILGVVLAFTLLLTSPTLAWWDADWNYRRPITIHSDNALTDYQILVQLNGTNFDFSKAKSDGSDVRFVDEDDATKLSYWIEEWNSTSQTAKIWVKVPSIPAGNKTIYLYYGNSGTISESNGEMVFDFFDNFEDGDLNGWSFSGSKGWQISTNSYEGNYGAQNQDIGDSQSACMQRNVTLQAQGRIYFWWSVSSESYDKLKFYIDGSEKAVISGSVSWQQKVLDLSSGTHEIKWCYTKDESVSCGADTGYVDLIYILKYVSSKPSILVGAEEILLPIEVMCISPTTLQIKLIFTEKNGHIFVGTSPDKFTYAYEFHGNGTYTLTTTFLLPNETYYIKACDIDGNCTDVIEFACNEKTELEKKNFTAPFNNLMQGGNLLNISKLGETIPSVYTSLLTDMFWAMFFGGIFLAYWIRQEDVMLPSIVGMIGGVAMIGLLPPSAQHIAYILLVISIAGTLYTIIKARR